MLVAARDRADVTVHPKCIQIYWKYEQKCSLEVPREPRRSNTEIRKCVDKLFENYDMSVLL